MIQLLGVVLCVLVIVPTQNVQLIIRSSVLGNVLNVEKGCRSAKDLGSK